MFGKTFAVGVTLALTGAALGQAEGANQTAEKAEENKPLIIGDKAPPLTIETWIKGEAIPQLESNHVYVVEFWATWCPPCVASIPHLTELEHELAGKGVTVIGVAASERGEGEGRLTNLQAFVEAKGDTMDYRVAYDEDRSMSQTWMQAAGQRFIPTAFVVNKEGRVAWIGSPLPGNGLDEVIDQVLAGEYDLEAAAAKARKAAELRLKVEPVEARLQEAMAAKDYEAAVKASEELIELGQPQAVMMKFSILAMSLDQYEEGYAFLDQATTTTLKDDAQALNEVAWRLLTDPRLTERNHELALKAAQRANELTSSKDASILDTLAKAYFDSGDVENALKYQQMAVDAAADQPNMLPDLQQRLTEYREAKNKG